MAIVLCGCATTNEEQDSYVFQSNGEYVRLVPIEPEAPPNSHPFAISADQLRRLLSGIEVKRASSIDAVPVFKQEELATIVPPLVTALSKARPDQDVAFAVAGHRGMFGRFSPESVTTGRLFVAGDSLNLIFGLVQARLDMGELDLTYVNPEVVPGERARRVGDPVWQIEPGRGHLHEQRGDWVVFNRSAIPAPAAEPARAAPSTREPGVTPQLGTQPDAGTPARVEEIEKRLRVLDELRERGVITDEEYLERRQAILEEL